jgi:hypothetical protein
MSQIQHDIEFLGRHPFFAIVLSIFSFAITFIDELELGLKIIALIVSILVGIVTIIGKVQEINRNGKAK